MEAASAWQSSSGWSGCRFRPGANKEVFDAEVLAIYQALRVMDQCQESSHCYTVFVDSAIIDKVRTGAVGPGQRFAIAAMEDCAKCDDLRCTYKGGSHVSDDSTSLAGNTRVKKRRAISSSENIANISQC